MKTLFAGLMVVLFLMSGCAKEPEFTPCAKPVPGRPPTEQEIRACLGDAEYERILAEKVKQAQIEVIACEGETADWYGKTGLPVSDEMHLSEYLRLELGEPCALPGSLRASDLEYLGIFPDGAGQIHFWAIKKGGGGGIFSFAYVEIKDGKRGLMGWGDKKPPEKGTPNES